MRRLSVRNAAVAAAIGMALGACAGTRPGAGLSGMPGWATGGDGLTGAACVLASSSVSIDSDLALAKAQVKLAQLLKTRTKGKTSAEEVLQDGQASESARIYTGKEVDTLLTGTRILKQDYATINGAQHFCVKVGLAEPERSASPAPGKVPAPMASQPVERPASPAHAPPVLPVPGAGRRVALVIGNAGYSGKLSPLQNPVNDAKDMAAALEKLGFEVALVTDADLPAMDEAVRGFLAKLQADSQGLFYFSGHGVQVDNSNYLVPLRADIASEAEVKARAYDVGIVLDGMGKQRNRLNLLILDACRDAPFKGFKAVSGGLAEMHGPTGTLIAFASAPGKTASDNSGGDNSLYTKHLLRHIFEPGVKIEEMLKEVRLGVTQESDRQTPWENSSLLGDFCFAGCAVGR